MQNQMLTEILIITVLTKRNSMVYLIHNDFNDIRYTWLSYDFDLIYCMFWLDLNLRDKTYIRYTY